MRGSILCRVILHRYAWSKMDSLVLITAVLNFPDAEYVWMSVLFFVLFFFSLPFSMGTYVYSVASSAKLAKLTTSAAVTNMLVPRAHALTNVARASMLFLPLTMMRLWRSDTARPAYGWPFLFFSWEFSFPWASFQANYYNERDLSGQANCSWHVHILTNTARQNNQRPRLVVG